MSLPNLSPHLSYAEAVHSDTALRAGLDNKPTAQAVANLERVATMLFEPLRLECGPLIVTSGYRSPALNSITPGSSETSAHTYGCALDIKPAHLGVRLSTILLWLRQTDLPFDQVIYEYAAWIHVAVPRIGFEPRRQVLMKFAGLPYQPFDLRYALR